jgi:transcriptional regulator with XRE-family HTH domain
LPDEIGRALRAKLNAWAGKKDRTYIAGIETGRRNISVKNFEKIAKVLGVKTNDLL